MRNTKQYPITLEEMIEACERAYRKEIEERPLKIGSIQAAALKEAAVRLKRLQFAAQEGDY